MFEAQKNLKPGEIIALIGRSKHKAVRRIADPRSGDIWYWKAELATHAEGAEKLGVPYDRRPGEGGYSHPLIEADHRRRLTLPPMMTAPRFGTSVCGSSPRTMRQGQPLRLRSFRSRNRALWSLGPKANC